MEPAPLRPTFTIPLAGPRDEAVARLRAQLAATPDLTGRWHGKGRWAELHVPASDMRIWSPCLSIRLDQDVGDACLFGRFGPRPEVWTFFMFLYGLVAFLALFGGILGYVQWSSGQAAWGLWAVWLGVPALGLMHLAGWLAQRRSRQQMIRLRREVEGAVEEVPGGCAGKVRARR